MCCCHTTPIWPFYINWQPWSFTHQEEPLPFLLLVFLPDGEVRDRECDSADGNSFNNKLGVLASRSSWHTALQAALCPLGWRTRSPREATAHVPGGGTLVGGMGGSLFVSIVFPGLGERGRDPVRFLQLLGQSSFLWMRPWRGRRERQGLCFSSSWVMPFIHSQPSRPALFYLKGRSFVATHMRLPPIPHPRYHGW